MTSNQSDHRHRSNRHGNPYRSPQLNAHVIPSASKWLPVFSRYLGLKSRKQQQFLLIGCIAVILVVWFLTPLSDYCALWILHTVPISMDVALGQRALLSLERKYPRVSDRWGVGRIGMQLVKAGALANQDTMYQNRFDREIFDNIQHYSWDFGVVKAPQDMVNAFALPGGIVRVTDSLLNELHLTDGELAALLGHEMGHVLHRHSQKRAIKNDLITTVWKAFTYDDHDEDDESFGEAVAEGLWKSASDLGELAFSRTDEYQADDASWRLLKSTNQIKNGRNDAIRYNPKSLRSLLLKLWRLHGGPGSTAWESTHPGTKDRILALEKKWNGLSTVDRRRYS